MAKDLQRVLALCQQLLEIDSVTADETRIADVLQQRLEARQPHALVRAGNSLCVVMRAPDESKPTLMLVGHTDTVPKFSDNPVRREGDKLYGLGASDMKAADAVLLDALERNKEEAANCNLVAVLYAREEGPYVDSEMPLIYDAAKEWFDATDLAICMEPTDNRIELGCLGTSHVRVTYKGKRAHSARPWQGDNAIHKAAGLLDRLAKLERKEHIYFGLSFYEVVSATMVEYRGARNVVPDQFVVNINYRFAPGQDEAAVRSQMEGLLQGEAEFEIVDFCPAGKVCGDNPLLKQLQDVAGNPEVVAKQAWTDVGRLSNLGIDAINWGPGATSQAHQDGEWVSVQEIQKSVEIVDRWLFVGR